MPRVAQGLSAASVKKTEPGRYGDGDGLYLTIRVSKQDPKKLTKFWTFRYVRYPEPPQYYEKGKGLKLEGKRKSKMTEIGLGSAVGRDAVSLADARQAAREHWLIHRAGGDPLAEKKKNRRSLIHSHASGGRTFQQAGDDYITAKSGEWHNPKHAKQWETTRRRFNMLPFLVTISDAERDNDLGEKLKAEWPGILAWMIEGCLEWQRDGMKPPKIVTDETGDYLDTEDTFGRWIEQCFDRDAKGWIGSTELFQSWQKWAEVNHEAVGSLKYLSTRMRDNGYIKKRDKNGDKEGFIGLKVKELPSEILSVHIIHENEDGMTVQKVFSSLEPAYLSKSDIIKREQSKQPKIFLITIPGLLARSKGLLDDEPGEEF